MKRKEKVEFIKNRFPDFQSIGRTSLARLDEIKRALCAEGFYKLHENSICDTTILNLVTEAQGKRVTKTHTARFRGGK